ncbi:MAG: cytochrome c-type biogenesis protein [Acidimicrobiales bacterium]
MTVRKALRVLAGASLVLVAAAALVIGSHRPAPSPTLAARVNGIAVGVRCPVCGGQNVADSNTYAAHAIKVDITSRLRSGETPAQIRAYLVSRYGTRILESPPTGGIAGLVWWVPAVAIPAAAVGLLMALRRSRPSPVAPPSEADRALVGAALRSTAPPPRPDLAEGGPVEETGLGTETATDSPSTPGRDLAAAPLAIGDERTTQAPT